MKRRREPLAPSFHARWLLGLSASAAALALVAAPSSAGAVGRPVPGAATAQTLKLPSGPGSARGMADDASVNAQTGQVDYVIPIELPKGLGGLSPQLSLHYDGALGNGPLGVGWSLSQGAIRRSLRRGVPSYTAADELELSGLGGGGQVVPLASGELRVEGRGNAYRGRAVDGGFELVSPDGAVYRFGTSAASRKASGAQVAIWYLERVSDVAGHAIDYHYAQDRGEVYLSAITWGPLSGGAPAFRAELVYQARGDARVDYRAGFRVETAQRLEQIRVWSFGGLRQTIACEYEADFALSRLTKVTTSGSVAGEALPPLTLRYATTAAAQTVEVPDLGGWALNLQGTSLLDVDGDGAMDLLRLTSNGHSYRRNLGGRFDAARPVAGGTGASLDVVRLADLDGDSAADMVWQRGSQWSFYAMGGESAATRSWSAPLTWGGVQGVSITNLTFADVNGDYRVDALSPSGSSMQVRIGGPTGFAAPVLRGAIDPARSYIAPGNASTSFPDLNGDGLADVLHLSSSSMFLYLGKGNGQFEKYKDVLYPWGSGVATSQIHTGDLDRDGLLDFVITRAGDVAWYRGRADGTLAATPILVPRPPGTDASIVVAVADANGNGSEDLVWSHPTGMWLVDFAGATSAGMLTEVHNGLGKTLRFEYRASTDLAFEAASNGAPWLTSMPLSMPVATRSRAELASGEPPRSSLLEPRDPTYDRGERRFLGFQESTVTMPDPADGGVASQRVRYHRRFAAELATPRVLRGQVLSERISDGAGVLLRELTYQRTALPIDGLPATDPRLRVAALEASNVRHVEGSTTPLETRTRYQHDGDGRVTREDRDGRLDLTGDESALLTTYTAADAATGVRDKVRETELRGPANELASLTRFLYGDATTTAPLGQPSKGWLREQQSWLASESRFVTTSAARYDAHGNAVSTTTGGVESRLTFDANGLFALEERQTISPGQDLVWTATWNPLHGAIATLTDPNNHTSSFRYDGLGRLAGVALDGHAEHRALEYAWTPPYPRTITWEFDGLPGELTARPSQWSPTSKWRQRVEVYNGAGETRYAATRLDTARWIISSYAERDALGRVSFAGQPAYSSSLELATRPADMAGAVLTYEAMGRVIEQRSPTGATRLSSYAPLERTTTEPELAPVRSVFDGEGRIMRTERSLPDGTHELVEAKYDAAGRIVRMWLADGALERRFQYDTLGRLLESHDPDVGTRTLGWDDANRLVSESNGAGQSVLYTYDALGRLASREADQVFRFHYDAARPGSSSPVANLVGNLAWIEEPTGYQEVGYDAFGHQTFSRRAIDAQVSQLITQAAPNGLVRSRTYADGFALSYSYDPAGRLIGVGDLWQLLEQDAAGQPMLERAQSGLETSYSRDVLGLPAKIMIGFPGVPTIYDVESTRNDWGALEAIEDLNDAGLDHNATFTYDGFARLKGASVGAGAGAFLFGYSYDRLQNMTARTAVGPRALNAHLGAYHYGAASAGPRQLTSITGGNGAVAHTFAYDAAGRQTHSDDLTMTYDVADRLRRVDGLPGGPLVHEYGHDGQRVKTTTSAGATSYFFGDGTTIRGGVREHEVSIGERTVARVALAPSAAASPASSERAAGSFGGLLGRSLGGGLAAVGVSLSLLLLLLGSAFSLLRGERRRRLHSRVFGSLAAATLLALSCASPTQRAGQHSTTSVGTSTFLHNGFGVGPVLYTNSDGAVLEERRSGPFGEPIDARVLTPTGYVVGDHDLAARDLSSLNKRVDRETGWSDHGARWMSSQTARWLTPDPPITGPDASFMEAPWALHPYQYVHQNPVVYWDPDGRDALAQELTAQFNGVRNSINPIKQLPVAVMTAAAIGDAVLTEVAPVALDAGVSSIPVVGTAWQAYHGASAGEVAVSAALDVFSLATGGAGQVCKLEVGALKVAASVGRMESRLANLAVDLAPAVRGIDNVADRASAAGRIFHSKDPLVGGVATAIDRAYPGHVVGVNVPVVNSAGQLVTDADILLKNAVLQVKSRGGSGLTNQLARTQAATDLPVIGYGPDLGLHVVKGIEKAGGLVTRELQVLIDVVAP